MAFIEWSEKMSVGNRKIDEQHKILVEMINALYEDMSRGKGDRAMLEAVRMLVSYTKTHFSHEEGVMKRIEYPGLQEHLKLHKAFTDKVEDLYKKMQAGEYFSPVALGGFLKDWLVAHIMKEDRKYAAHGKARTSCRA